MKTIWKTLPAYKYYKDEQEAQDMLAQSGLARDVDTKTWLEIAHWMYERDASPGEAVRESGLMRELSH